MELGTVETQNDIFSSLSRCSTKQLNMARLRKTSGTIVHHTRFYFIPKQFVNNEPKISQVWFLSGVPPQGTKHCEKFLLFLQFSPICKSRCPAFHSILFRFFRFLFFSKAVTQPLLRICFSLGQNLETSLINSVTYMDRKGPSDYRADNKVI